MPTAKQAANASQTIKELVDSQISETTEEQPVETKTGPNSRKYNPTTDDFFDYICKTVTQTEWETGGSCLYIYKQAQTGNEQLERIFRPISLDEFRDNYVSKYGPGNYLLQFQTRIKQLSPCSKRLSFDAKGGVLGEAASGSLGPPAYMPGFTSAINATSDMLKDAARAAVEVSKSGQIESAKGPDIAAIVTAIAGVMPKGDGTKDLLPILLQVQKESASASQAQFTAILTLIQNQASQTLAMVQANAGAQLESLKATYKVLLDEKDKKAEDSLGMMGILKDLFAGFVQDRFEEGGHAAPAKDWIGLVDKLAPAISQLAGPIAAKLTGSPMPPFVPQPQINPSPSQGTNGESKYIPPNADELTNIFVRNLVQYLYTHEEYDVEHWVEVTFAQYAPVASIIEQFPKEQIIERLKHDPIGQHIFNAPNGELFLESLIEEIKKPEESEIPEDEGIPSRKSKAKTI